MVLLNEHLALFNSFNNRKANGYFKWTPTHIFKEPGIHEQFTEGWLKEKYCIRHKIP